MTTKIEPQGAHRWHVYLCPSGEGLDGVEMGPVVVTKSPPGDVWRAVLPSGWRFGHDGARMRWERVAVDCVAHCVRDIEREG